MFAKTVVKKIGECEGCPSLDVEIFLNGRNMWLCQSCHDKDAAVAQAISTIKDAKKQQEDIKLVTDVFNAGTRSFIEIQAAVQQNEEIAESDKRTQVLDLAVSQYKALRDAIFQEKAALEAKVNAAQALQVNIQEMVGTLHKEQQAKYKEYALNYKPETPTVKKPKADKAPSSGKASKWSKKELEAAITKYKEFKLDEQLVRFYAVKNNWTAEQAAAHIVATLKD